MPPEIRLLTPADAAAFWTLRLEALSTYPEAFSVAADEHRATSIADAAARLGENPAETFVVGAFVDAALVGTAGFHRQHRAKLRHKGEIWGVYVTASARGAGIGHAVLQFLLARAAQVEGIERILVSAATTQAAAIKLYRSLGFQSFATEQRAVKIGDRYVDYESMVLTVGAANGG